MVAGFLSLRTRFRPRTSAAARVNVLPFAWRRTVVRSGTRAPAAGTGHRVVERIADHVQQLCPRKLRDVLPCTLTKPSCPASPAPQWRGTLADAQPYLRNPIPRRLARKLPGSSSTDGHALLWDRCHRQTWRQPSAGRKARQLTGRQGKNRAEWHRLAWTKLRATNTHMFWYHLLPLHTT